MEYKRVFRDGFNLFLGNIGTTLIGLLNMMILTRVLSTEDMGKYSLFLMITNLAVQLGLNWSDASVLRHGREEFVKHGKINKSFWARFYLFAPFVLFLISVYLIFNRDIAKFVSLEPTFIIHVIGVFVFTGLLHYLMNVYRSIDKVRRSAFVFFSQKLIYFSGLVLIFFKIIESNVILAIIFLNLSFLIALIVNLIGFNFKMILPYQFDKTYFKKIWSYSWPQLIGFSGVYAINYIDLYVIRRYMTLQDVGIYNVAYTGFSMITGLLFTINSLFLPLIVEYRAKKKHHLISSYIKKIPLFSLLWIVLVLLGLLSSRFIIPILFSEKYIQSIPSFNILLITSIFFFISVCFTPLINSFDLVFELQTINIISAIINIVGDFILVPKMGIIGAAYATMLSYVFNFVSKIILVKKKVLINENRL